MKINNEIIEKTSDLYTRNKINWTEFYVQIDGCQNDSPIEFNIMPKDYLMFAKNNIKEKVTQTQNCIDAMSNTKRAIECQIDLLINTLGYDYKTFDKRNMYPVTKAFIKSNFQEEQCDGLTDRLKLLNILGLAPTLILSNIRKLRNQMEHEYIELSYQDVKGSIEVAELFINSSNGKLYNLPTLIDVGNTLIDKDENSYSYYNIQFPFLRLEFDTQNSTDTVKIFIKDNDDSHIGLILKPNDKFYIEVIYCLLSSDYSKLPFIFECDVKQEFIKFEEV
ncbi:MAG TPA: hypothetical protein VIK78_03045 [Ruminiclostridium sp.]